MRGTARLPVKRSTYPGQQSLPLCDVVDEFEGPGRAVDPAVHIPIKVQQSQLLLLAAVRCLHLWAAWKQIRLKVLPLVLINWKHVIEASCTVVTW